MKSSTTQTMAVNQSQMKEIQVGLLKKSAMKQHNNKPDMEYNMTAKSTIDFGPESCRTPRRSARDCDISFDPPLLLRRKNLYRKNSQKHRRAHLTTSIDIPLLKSKGDNQPSYQLLPRKKRAFNLSPRPRLKIYLSDTPDFCRV